MEESTQQQAPPSDVQLDQQHDVLEATNKKLEEFTLKSASDVAANEYLQYVCEEDLDTMKQRQMDMYGRFRQSNQALKKFNEDTAKKLSVVHFDYQGHARMLKEMKSDLEHITKKIKCVIFFLSNLCCWCGG